MVRIPFRQPCCFTISVQMKEVKTKLVSRGAVRTSIHSVNTSKENEEGLVFLQEILTCAVSINKILKGTSEMMGQMFPYERAFQ